MNIERKHARTRSSERVSIADLRARIARLEHSAAPGACESPAVSLGVRAIDASLPGNGLSHGNLHEVSGDDGAALAFSAVLLGRFSQAARPGAAATVLWCRKGNDLYAPGLEAFGLDPANVLLVRAGRDRDLLWAMEEGLRSGALAAVLGEPAKIDTTALRRLQLAAENGGTAGFLLHGGEAWQAPGPLATRWRMAPLASHGRDVRSARPLGQPRWQLQLVRCRNGRPANWAVEWREDADEHETTDGRAAPGLALVSEAGDGPAGVAAADASRGRETGRAESRRLAG